MNSQPPQKMSQDEKQKEESHKIPVEARPLAPGLTDTPSRGCYHGSKLPKPGKGRNGKIMIKRTRPERKK